MRYLLSGYYGEKNAGDEAILAGILQEIERRDPGARFTVLSFDPDDTEERHGRDRELVAIPTSLRSPRLLRTVMKGADLLISGGGSFLHEADFELHGRSFLFRQGKLRPVPYFLSIVLMARACGLPVMWYAQGLGPLHTRSARRLTALAASLSQALTWRDPDSARLAWQLGVRGPVQLVVPDPAYALSPAAPEEVDEVLKKLGLGRGGSGEGTQTRGHQADRDRPPTGQQGGDWQQAQQVGPQAQGEEQGRPQVLPQSRRFLAVCPRPWLGRTGFLEALGKALEEILLCLDLELLLVPFHELQDPPVCETLAARPALAGRAHLLPLLASPALLAGVLGAAEAVVAMRLHSGILAAVAGTPAVVLDYDPKTRAFAAQTRQLAWAVSVDELERQGESLEAMSGPTAGSSRGAYSLLVEAVLDTLRHLPARRAALARAVAPLRSDAGRTAALAAQLARSRGKLKAARA